MGTMIFGFLCVFAAICVLGVIAYKSMKVLLDYFSSKQIANSQAYSVPEAGMASNRTLLIQKFIEATGSSNYIHRNRSERYIAQPFLDRLSERFNIQIEVQSCSYDKAECVTLLKLVGKDGKEYFAVCNDSLEPANNSDNNPRYELSGSSQQLDNFVEVADNEEHIRMLKNIEIVYSNLYGDTNADLVFLRDTMAEFVLQTIRYEYPIEDLVRTYEMTFRNGQYLLMADKIAVLRLDKDADKLYAPVSINYQGEKHTILASDAVEQASIALSGSRNVYIWGIPGTGKTRLLDQIIAKAYDRTDSVAIVRLTPTAFKEVQSAGALAQFKDAVESLEADKVIFIMDEAESLLRPEKDGTHSEIASAMLSLLDGSLRTQLKCNTILVFNAEPEILDQALFRPGREGLSLRLDVLPKHIAVEGVKYLQEQMPDMVFDEKAFEKTLNEENKDYTSKVYCPKNHITLAALVSCFISPEENDHLIDAIRAAAIAFNSEFKPADVASKKLSISLIDTKPTKTVTLAPLPRAVTKAAKSKRRWRKPSAN